jgi:ABC-2 type transport system ATP-binding protein
MSLINRQYDKNTPSCHSEFGVAKAQNLPGAGQEIAGLAGNKTAESFYTSCRQGASNAIEVDGLRVSYPGFELNASFNVPTGFVTGFIGKNGAGKTTTLKALLGMAIPNAGSIQLLGRPAGDVTLKDELGILFEQPYFQEDWTHKDIERAISPFYSRWSSEVWQTLLERFGLPQNRKFKQYSRGMRMKLGLAAALAHDAQMLILDEPTGGLDSVARDEMLDIFHEYVLDENKTVFFSTHITSDLEKIADRVILISKGKIIFDMDKDELLEKFALVRGGGYDCLMAVSNLGGLPRAARAEKPTLDDLIIYFEKGRCEDV